MLLNQIYTIAFMAFLAAGFFFRKNNDDSASKYVDLCFCMTVALVASTFFTLFPLTKTYPLADSSVFIYIGKMMHKGLIPYRDMFDHKGILLYFIQYLGLFISEEGYLGIWIMELIHMFFTVWFMFKISGIFSKDRINRYLSIVAVAVMCGMHVYEGGNLTEEYALPWITYALYVFLNYFKNNAYRFSQIIWLGIGFAVVTLLRVNMIAVWLAFMPLVFIHMMYKAEYKDLVRCIIGFVLGLLIVFIPTAVYLVWTGSFKDFIECYLIFNFAYSDGGNNFTAIFDAILACIRNLPWAFAAGVIAIISNRKNKLFWLNVWALIVSLYFAHMSGHFYVHYGIIILPLLIPLVSGAITVLYNLLSVNGRVKFRLDLPKNGIMISGFILTILGAVFLQYKWANLIREAVLQSANIKEIQECIWENTSEDDDVLVVGNSVMYYLLTDRKTENRYFYQSPPIKISDKVYEGFIREFERCQSEAVVVIGEKEDCLTRDDNLGKAYQYIERKALEGKYDCQEYDDYYIYTKVGN